ncbi:MAG: hypothetical protein JNK57_17110 [Planctomycetaceae bacterium]|jgi:uncharacterized protein YdcH (DUF465 family)|nr:hypothetical protein [Planctomycetaceae bacterium]
MLFYIIVGVLFLVLVILLVLIGRKGEWHWAHITAVVLVFLTAAPGYYCMAYVLKTRKAIVKEYHEASKALENERTKYLNVLYGAEPGTRGGFGDGSLKAELSRYRLLTTGKGRSWDQAVLQGRNGNEATFEIPAAAAADPAAAGADAAPADAAPADAAPAGAPVAPEAGEYPLVGSLIYAFQLTGLTIAENRQVAVPGNYMGAFRVTAATGTTITATAQSAMPTTINIGDGVALFERPPQDTNDVMNMALGFDADAKPTIDEYRERFQTVFPAETFNLDGTSKAYQDMLDAFSFDGRAVTDIDTWLSKQDPSRPAWNPGVEEVMVVSRILTQFEETVDGTQDMVTSGVFDSLGRANDPELQLGKPAQIAASREGDDSDVVLIDEATASAGYTRQDGTQVRSWEEERRSQPVNRLYVRRLRDYTTEIEQLKFEQNIFDERIAEYNRLNASVTTSVQAADAQEQIRQTKITELSQDQENLKGDLQIANDYLANLEARLADLRREIRDTYLQISHLHQQSSQEAQAWSAAQQ